MDDHHPNRGGRPVSTGRRSWRKVTSRFSPEALAVIERIAQQEGVTMTACVEMLALEAAGDWIVKPRRRAGP